MGTASYSKKETMMIATRVTPCWAAVALVALLGLTLGAGPSAKAQTFTVLYSFAGYPTDGAGPGAGVAGGN